VRLTMIDSLELENHRTPNKPVYAPAVFSDPVTHQDFQEEDEFRDWRMAEGAAGVRTDRLTYLNTCTMTTQATIARSPLAVHHRRTDPISHFGGEDPDLKLTGLRRIDKSGSSAHMRHSSQPPRTPSREDIKGLLKGRQVHAPGEMLYNVAGGEDMLPAATRQFYKADMPVSDELRRWNEAKFLPSFDRSSTSKQGNPGLLGSEDMYYAMCGPEHGRRMLALDRTGRLEEEETAYGPGWVMIEISKGGTGQHTQRRAKSLEPTRQERSDTPGAEGSLTARQAAREPMHLSGPLRWPSQVQAFAEQELCQVTGQAKESAPFRTPNGVSDWGGLSGLGIWKSAARPPSARSPSLSRTKTPERERPRTPPRSGSSTGYVFRAAPGGMISPGGNYAASDGRGSYVASPQRRTPRDALDRTREKGAEFPRTPMAKTPQQAKATSGGGKMKGVWSRPSDTMRLASPAVEVFSL